MIYTLTMNPAIDYVAGTAGLLPGGTNRTLSEEYYPGGKGVNVSLVLASLGCETTALGISGGWTGRALEEMLAAHGCKTDFVRAEGLTRLNVKLNEAGKITELNGRGCAFDQKCMDKILAKISRISAGDTLVLGGSLPQGAPTDTYARLIEAAPAGVRLVLDAEGEVLRRAVDLAGERLFLIKPNRDELGGLFDTEIQGFAGAVEYGARLIEKGVQNVLVSLGEEGAVLLFDIEVFIRVAPKGQVVNTVGAGDSMLAGFLAAGLRGENLQEALREAVRLGSRAAFSQWLPI